MHKKYFWRRTSLQIFSFPNAHYSSGIGDHLLPRTFKEWSCQVCTTLLIPLKFWFHLHFSQKLNECSLSPLLHVLMVHCMLCLLRQCSCVCKCITTHTEKFQWLKSCSSPLYPVIFRWISSWSNPLYRHTNGCVSMTGRKCLREEEGRLRQISSSLAPNQKPQAWMVALNAQKQLFKLLYLSYSLCKKQGLGNFTSLCHRNKMASCLV